MEPNKGEDAQARLPKDKPPQEAEEAQDRQEAVEDHQEALLEEEAPHLRNSSSSSHHHQQRLSNCPLSVSAYSEDYRCYHWVEKEEMQCHRESSKSCHPREN